MRLFKGSKKSKYSLPVLKKKALGEIYSSEEFRRIVEKERARADRNDHILSLVVFDLGTSGLKYNTSIQLIENICGRIRFIDELGWYDKQRIAMILPYTSNKGATKLAENICESLDGATPKPVCTVYTYPVDKLNDK